MSKKSDIWIGMAEVRGRGKNEILDSATEGAFVNVVALATDERDFVERVDLTLSTINLGLENISDIELYSHRLLHHEPDQDIKDIAASLGSAKPHSV